MKIRSHNELDTYKMAFECSKEIFKLSKKFPRHEMFSLTDQIRKQSRSVCANLAEAFRKRKYPKSFVSKLSDSEGEAAETQVWLDYCKEHNYIDTETHKKLYRTYDQILGKLVTMAMQPEKWSY